MTMGCLLFTIVSFVFAIVYCLNLFFFIDQIVRHWCFSFFFLKKVALLTYLPSSAASTDVHLLEHLLVLSAVPGSAPAAHPGATNPDVGHERSEACSACPGHGSEECLAYASVYGRGGVRRGKQQRL